MIYCCFCDDEIIAGEKYWLPQAGDELDGMHANPCWPADVPIMRSFKPATRQAIRRWRNLRHLALNDELEAKGE